MAGEPNALYGAQQPQTQPQQQNALAEHPVMSAARRGGLDPYQAIQSGDINALFSAAMKGDPRLATDSGVMMLEDFAQQFKQQFGVTNRQLPGAQPPADMPNALMGGSGRPHSLPRPFDEDSPQEYQVYQRDFQRQYGR